ncbi:MAG: hypothetical protein JXQ71_05810 [Verrucomicrobia bacterium]|nr:hypothetical protein [Verrucomicrobiota bacterium]
MNLSVFAVTSDGTMKFIFHPEVRANAQRSVRWVKTFLARFDLSSLGWLRIDFGREYKDGRGRRYRKYRGVYGRCWYPSEDQPTVRMSCQVPGPFPCDIVTRKKPVYQSDDGTWPSEARGIPGPVMVDRRSGRRWKRVYGKTIVHDLDEAIVWIVAHEAFHWLRHTRQVPGRNTEVEADAYADRQLAAFRAQPPPPAPVSCPFPVTWKQSQFDFGTPQAHTPAPQRAFL